MRRWNDEPHLKQENLQQVVTRRATPGCHPGVEEEVLGDIANTHMPGSKQKVDRSKRRPGPEKWAPIVAIVRRNRSGVPVVTSSATPDKLEVMRIRKPAKIGRINDDRRVARRPVQIWPGRPRYEEERDQVPRSTQHRHQRVKDRRLPGNRCCRQQAPKNVRTKKST